MGGSETEFSFQRYLAAKVALDDRSLNRHVWETLKAGVGDGSLDVVELGAGIGTMFTRLQRWGLMQRGRYVAVDSDPASMAEAARLAATAGVTLQTEVADLRTFARRPEQQRRYDLVVAHAVLDLLDLPQALPAVLGLLKPGGLYYFTLNFDGVTLFEPVIEAAFDAEVLRLYHDSMDSRHLAGVEAGHSQTGRKLAPLLQALGSEVLAAGSSDWVVFAGRDGYPGDEAYFLRHILHFFRQSVGGRPGLDQRRFADWLATREAQIERGELVYIAHQIDVCGRVPG